MNELPDFIFPDKNGFKGIVLDTYLENGFYRTQHFLFTTNETPLGIGHKNFPVFWLRIAINNCRENKQAIAIRKKTKGFKVTFYEAKITTEINDLYKLYLADVKFEAAETCNNYLHDCQLPNPFNSQMVQVKDGERLIAVGYFDVGLNALAGILNFFDPHYKKFSLGKLLMLAKIDFAIDNNIKHYYLGYMSTQSSKFDYKIFPDKAAVEVLLSVEKNWVNYKNFGKEKLQEYFEKNKL